MKEPLEDISFNFAFAVLQSGNEPASVPTSISQSFIQEDPVLTRQLLHRIIGSTISNAQTSIKF